MNSMYGGCDLPPDDKPNMDPTGSGYGGEPSGVPVGMPETSVAGPTTDSGYYNISNCGHFFPNQYNRLDDGSETIVVQPTAVVRADELPPSSSTYYSFDAIDPSRMKHEDDSISTPLPPEGRGGGGDGGHSNCSIDSSNGGVSDAGSLSLKHQRQQRSRCSRSKSMDGSVEEMGPITAERHEELKRKRAEQARQRYHRMSEEERREYNYRRRHRQRGLDEDGERIRSDPKLEMQLKEANRRKAEAARRRYHTMTDEERREYNDRRTQAFRKRRQEEEELLSCPALRITPGALEKAQQIVTRNARKAAAARERYSRMSAEERKLYNQRRAHLKRKRDLELDGSVKMNGDEMGMHQMHEGDLETSSAAVGLIEDEHSAAAAQQHHHHYAAGDEHREVVTDGGGGVQEEMVEEEEVEEEEGDQGAMSDCESIRMDHPSRRMEAQMKMERDSQEGESSHQHSESQQQHQQQLMRSSRKGFPSSRAAEQILAAAAAAEARESLEYAQQRQREQIVLHHRRVNGDNGEYDDEDDVGRVDVDEDDEHCWNMHPGAALGEVIIEQVDGDYGDERIEVDDELHHMQVRSASTSAHIYQYATHEHYAEAPGMVQHEVVVPHSPHHRLHHGMHLEGDEMDMDEMQWEEGEALMDAGRGYRPRASSQAALQRAVSGTGMDALHAQRLAENRAKRALRARARYANMTSEQKAQTNARRAEQLRKSRRRDMQLVQLAQTENVVVDDDTRKEVEAVQMRRKLRAEQARRKYRKMSEEERRQYNAMRDAQRRSRRREQEGLMDIEEGIRMHQEDGGGMRRVRGSGRLTQSQSSSASSSSHPQSHAIMVQRSNNYYHEMYEQEWNALDALH